MTNNEKAGYRDFVHYPMTWIRQIDRCNKCRSYREPNNFMSSVETLLSSLFPNLRKEVMDHINTLDEQDQYELCIIVFEKIIDILFENGYLKTIKQNIESGVDD